MGADPAARRLEHLLERYGLGARQRRQLDGLLSLLANDRHAPTSVRTPERAVDAHIADSLVALELETLRAAESIADLGSGAGFPGLSLALALEGSAVHLVESVARKCVFLERAIGELGLENARVVRGRAEEWSAGQGRNDVATARAVGPQPVVVEYAAPLLRTGGVLVDWRAGRAREQEQRGARAAAQVGMRPAEVRRVQPFVGARERHLHLYLKVTPTPAWLPRRPGAAVKRPLGAAPRPGAERVPARERASELLSPPDGVGGPSDRGRR